MINRLSMIINNSPTNKAILSNISQVNNFSIKATAKSFQILSSGLYANKIKAIIRELSCNAYDSHVAANKADIPFDIHLPNKIDPNFSIRDYGIGLSQDEVVNVYTTYFESTKTSSNEFVGALGLGSKSPFSYTDNFTITTVKNNIKGIYSAFINDSGVPSIALMSEAITDELTGVEIKFSVNNSEDMIKFIAEAVDVFYWFNVKPNVTGSSASNGYDDQVKKGLERSNELKGIIPGIRRYGNYRIFPHNNNISCAVMGNIAYPIDVPNIDQNLGDLGKLLRHKLIIDFAIGELDFQASREGLSYSPKTIEAIKNKLQVLSVEIYSQFLNDASKIDQNKWIFSKWIKQKSYDDFWKPSVIKYIKHNPSDLYYVHIPTNNISYTDRMCSFTEETLQEFNIKLTILAVNRGSNGLPLCKVTTAKTISWFIENNCAFFLNDTNTRAIARVKESIRSQSPFKVHHSIVIIEKIDKTQDYKIKSFFDFMYNPPQNIIFKVSSLPKSSNTITPTNSGGILKLSEDTSIRNRYNACELKWKTLNSLDNINSPGKNFYYIPLSGHTPITTKIRSLQFKEVIRRLRQSNLGENIDVYGVRKLDMEQVLSMSNWINIEDYIYSQIQNNKLDLIRSRMLFYYNNTKYDLLYNNTVLHNILSNDSPFKKIMVKLNYGKTKSSSINTKILEPILNDFDPNFLVEVYNYKKILSTELELVSNKYPLLSVINDYQITGAEQVIADYINLIDEKDYYERKTLCTHI